MNCKSTQFAIREIEALDRNVYLDMTHQSVKDSPPRDPVGLIDIEAQKRLRRHYNWPGYG